MSPFFQSMQVAEQAAEAMAGESWVFNDHPWPCVVLQGLSVGTVRVPGGKKAEAEARIQVLLTVIEESGVKESDIITLRGQRVRINKMEAHTPSARIFVCGPAGVTAPRV